jgi:hypothetical protein
MNHTIINIASGGRSSTTLTSSDHKTTPMLPGGTKFTSQTVHQNK